MFDQHRRSYHSLTYGVLDLDDILEVFSRPGLSPLGAVKGWAFYGLLSGHLSVFQSLQYFSYFKVLA